MEMLILVLLFASNAFAGARPLIRCGQDVGDQKFFELREVDSDKPIWKGHPILSEAKDPSEYRSPSLPKHSESCKHLAPDVASRT
jgi:hypothetical protein